MRILYLTDTRQIGGAERYLVNLAEGAAGAGHEVLVVAPQRDVVSYVEREAPGTRAIRALDDSYHDAMNPRRRVRALSRGLWSMVGLLHRTRPDLVHVNNGGWPGADLLRLAPVAARLARVPRCVMTVHNNPWPRGAAVQVVADQLVWPTTDAVVCPSLAVADGLRGLRGMPVSLQRLIYNGVRPPGGKSEGPRLRAQLAPDGEVLVGMVSARPVPEKGYDVFLDALRQVRARVRAVLVGRYPLGFKQRVEAAGLDSRLQLPGLRRDVGAYYHAFDLVAVPSTAHESTTLVVLEAAAAGTPAFGSRLSGIPEVIEEGKSGRTFPPGDAAALARLIDEAAKDREHLERMGREARVQWTARFSLDRMLEEHELLYSGLIATHA